jgi:hypothetical protein
MQTIALFLRHQTQWFSTFSGPNPGKMIFLSFVPITY